MSARFPVKVVLTPNGASLKFLGDAPRDFREGSQWRVDLCDADAAILIKEGAQPCGYFAGTLGSFSMGELFSHLLSGIRTGRLTVSQGALRKQVILRDGQVQFAVSNAPHERFGSVVVSLGMLSPEQVQTALVEVRPGDRLGTALARNGQLTAAQVYEAMSALVREITLSLFELTEGSFIFVEGLSASPDAVKLPESTRELLLEGIRRVEEVHALRRRWPPTAQLRRGLTRPPEALTGLLAMCGDNPEVSSLFALYEGSEYGFLKALDAWVHVGALVHEPERPRVSSAQTPSGSPALEVYQSLISEIAQALLRADKGLTPLRAYLLEPGPRLKAAFSGVHLTDEGMLDVVQVLANVGSDENAMDRVRTHAALDAFVAYALFSAQNALPEHEFLRLQRSAQAIRHEEVT